MIYADELGERRGAHLHARAAGGLERAHAGASTPELIAGAGIDDDGIAFVCGSNGFVEAAARSCCSDAGFEPRADPHRALRPDRLTKPFEDDTTALQVHANGEA